MAKQPLGNSSFCFSSNLAFGGARAFGIFGATTSVIYRFFFGLGITEKLAKNCQNVLFTCVKQFHDF